MRRIVHIITRLIRGGADENTLISCNLQSRRGDEVHLIVGHDVHQSMVKRLDAEVTIHHLPSLVRPLSLINDLAALQQLTLLLGQLRPDVVHTHTSKAGILGRIAAWLVGVKCIVHGVHILPFLNVSAAERGIYLWVERLLGRVTHAFISVSDGMMQSNIAHGVGLGAKHLVAPSGMDVDAFQRAKPISAESLARDLGIMVTRARSAKIVLMVAAFEARKRQGPFLSAFKVIAAREPDAILVLIGEGPDQADVINRIQNLGLEDRVFLSGYRDDVANWMARADVCVLSSEREGLPRVIVQYALCARPIVTTALPGVEAIVRPGVNGYLVGLDDIDAMAEPVCAILADSALAGRLSAGSRQLDLSAWSAEHMGEILESAYQQVLSTRRAGTAGALLTAGAPNG